MIPPQEIINSPKQVNRIIANKFDASTNSKEMNNMNNQIINE